MQAFEGVLHPDTLVGTDSHTTMINVLGIVGWGVGGIEAEAAMLANMAPECGATLHIQRREGPRDSVALGLRIDTPIEAAYFLAGGILPYVLVRLVAAEQ